MPSDIVSWASSSEGIQQLRVPTLPSPISHVSLSRQAGIPFFLRPRARARKKKMGALSAALFLLRGLAGAALGLAYARWGLPKDAGSAPRLHPTAWPLLYCGMIVIPLPGTRRRRCLHVHHWLVCAACLPWLMFSHPAAAGAALSLAAQGLRYDDCFVFVVDAPRDYRVPAWLPAFTSTSGGPHGGGAGGGGAAGGARREHMRV